MSKVKYMNCINNSIPNSYIKEYTNNELFTKQTGYTPLTHYQQQIPSSINMLNIPFYPNNTNPVCGLNMDIPVINEQNAIKKFNSGTTRSDSSSSSTSSSAMSSLSMNHNKYYNENSLYVNDSDLDLLDFKHRNNLSKLFEDDLIYCPRSLLSKQDLQRANMLLYEQSLTQNYFTNTYNKLTVESPCLTTTNMHSMKFNPYTSKSFNPTLPL